MNEVLVNLAQNLFQKSQVSWCSVIYEKIICPVFKLLIVGIVHSVKNCIHGPFLENVTALIKMWCFSRKRFITLGRKKSRHQVLPYTRKNVSVPFALRQTERDRPWVLIISKQTVFILNLVACFTFYFIKTLYQ